MSESEVKSDGKEEWMKSPTKPIHIGPTTTTTTTVSPNIIINNKEETIESPCLMKKLEDGDNNSKVLLLTSDSIQPFDNSCNDGSLLTTTNTTSSNITPISGTTTTTTTITNKGNDIHEKKVNNKTEVDFDDVCTNNNNKKDIVSSSPVETCSSTISPAAVVAIRTTSSSTNNNTKNNIKTLSTKISRNGKESVPVGIAVAYPRLVTSDSSINSNCNTTTTTLSSTDTMSCSDTGKSIKVSPTTTTNTTPSSSASTTTTSTTKLKNSSQISNVLSLPKRPLSASAAPGVISGKCGGGGGGGSDKNSKSSSAFGQNNDNNNVNSKFSDQKHRPASVIPIHHHHHHGTPPSLSSHWTSVLKQPNYSSLSGLSNTSQYTDWPTSSGLNVPHNYESAAAVYMQQLQQLHLSNARNNLNNHYGTHHPYGIYHGYSSEALQKYEQYLQQQHHHHQQQQQQELQYQHQLQQEYEIRRATTPIHIPSPNSTIHSHSHSHLWPPEFFHQNSSMALSPKSLTSTPSPVDTSHFLVNPSSRSRCATPTIIIATTGTTGATITTTSSSSSTSTSNNLKPPPVTIVATTPLSTSVNPFPYSPANFPNWKEVKIAPIPKKATATTAGSSPTTNNKKHKGENDDNNSILDVLTIEEEVRRENNNNNNNNTTINNGHNNDIGKITLDGKKHDFSRLESLIEKRDEVSVPMLNQVNNPFPDKYLNKNHNKKDKSNNKMMTPTTSTSTTSSNTIVTPIKTDKDKVCDAVNHNNISNKNNNNTSGKNIIKETKVEIKHEVMNNHSCDLEVDGVNNNNNNNKHEVPDTKMLLPFSLKQNKLLTPPVTPTTTMNTNTTVTTNSNSNNITDNTLFNSSTFTTSTPFTKTEIKHTTTTSSSSASSPLKKRSIHSNKNNEDNNNCKVALHVNGIDKKDIIVKNERSLLSNTTSTIMTNLPLKLTTKLERKKSIEDGEMKPFTIMTTTKSNPSQQKFQTKKCIYDNNVIVDMKNASDNDNVINNNNKHSDTYKNSTITNSFTNNHNTPIIMNVKKETYNTYSSPLEQQQKQPQSSSSSFSYTSQQNSKPLLQQNVQPMLITSNSSLGTKCDNDIIKTAPVNTFSSYSASYSDNSSLVYNNNNNNIISSSNSPAKEEININNRLQQQQQQQQNESQNDSKFSTTTSTDMYYHHQYQQFHQNHNLHQQLVHPIITIQQQEAGNRNQSYQLLNVPYHNSDTLEKEHATVDVLTHRFQPHHPQPISFHPIRLEQENNHLDLLATVAQEYACRNDLNTSGLIHQKNPENPIVDTYEFVEEGHDKIESFSQSQLTTTYRTGTKLSTPQSNNKHHHQPQQQQSKSIFSSSSPTISTTNTTSQLPNISFTSPVFSSTIATTNNNTNTTTSTITLSTPNSLSSQPQQQTVPPCVLKIPHVTPIEERGKKKPRRSSNNSSSSGGSNKTSKAEKRQRKQIQLANTNDDKFGILNKSETTPTSKGKGKKKVSSSLVVGMEKVETTVDTKKSINNKKRRKSTIAAAEEIYNNVQQQQQMIVIGEEDNKRKQVKSPKRPKIKKHEKSTSTSTNTDNTNNNNNDTLMVDGKMEQKTVDKIVIINTSKNSETKEHKVIMPLNVEKLKSTSDVIVMKKGNRSSLGSNLLLQNQSKQDKPIELVLSQVQQNLSDGSENPSSVVFNTTTNTQKQKKSTKKSTTTKSIKSDDEEKFILGDGSLNDEHDDEGRQSDKSKKKKPSQKQNARRQDLNNKKSKKIIPGNTLNLSNNNNNDNTTTTNTNNKKNKNISLISSSIDMNNIHSLNNNNDNNNVNVKISSTYEEPQPLQKTTTTNILSNNNNNDDEEMVEFNESQMFSPTSSNAENDWQTNPALAVTAIQTTNDNDNNNKESFFINSQQHKLPSSTTSILDGTEKCRTSPNKKDQRRKSTLMKESHHENNQTIIKMTMTNNSETELLIKNQQQNNNNNNKNYGKETSPRKVKQNGHSQNHHPIKPCLKAEPVFRSSPDEMDDFISDDESKAISEIESIISKSRRTSSQENSNTSPRRVCLQNYEYDDEDEEHKKDNSYTSNRQSIFQRGKTHIVSTTITSSSATLATTKITEKTDKGEINGNIKTQEGTTDKSCQSIKDKKSNLIQNTEEHEKVSIDSVSEMLNDMRILTEIQGLFYTGKLLIIAAPDVYGVTLDNERGQPPHFIFSQEEVLEKCIREVKPSYLTTGLRICAYWSPQYSGLYPGKVSVDYVASDNPENDLIPIEFDDGDTGVIKLNEIRLLPPHHPVSAYDPNPLLTLEKKHRKRRHSSATRSQSGGCSEEEISDCRWKVGKYEDTKEKHSSRLLYWTWKGLGYKKPRSKKDRNKEFFDGIQRGDEIINVGDSALFISNGNDRPFIGRVEKFWEKKGQKVVHVRWFYHPEEVKTNSRRLQGLKYTGALFESPHIDENDVQTIAKKCDVFPFEEFKQKVGCLTKWPSKTSITNTSSSSSQENIYYVAGFYDPYNYNLTLNNDLK